MEDLIKREDAIKAVAEPFEEELWDGALRSIRGVVSVLNDIPSAENKGEWIDCKGGWKCTACNKWSDSTYNFCPNCGARMKGESDDKERSGRNSKQL